MSQIKLLILLGLGFGSFAQAQGVSCINGLQSIHPEFRYQDLTYVCSARSSIRIDSDYNYNACILGLARISGDGEYLINTCRNGGGVPGGGRSCRENLSFLHPEWRPSDLDYICTARNRITADSNPSYTSCVVNRAYTSGDGEYIISSCINGGYPPQPQPQPQPQMCTCMLINQWGRFVNSGPNCSIALTNVLNSCSSSNPHAVCAGSQATCR